MAKLFDIGLEVHVNMWYQQKGFGIMKKIYLFLVFVLFFTWNLTSKNLMEQYNMMTWMLRRLNKLVASQDDLIDVFVKQIRGINREGGWINGCKRTKLGAEHIEVKQTNWYLPWRELNNLFMNNHVCNLNKIWQTLERYKNLSSTYIKNYSFKLLQSLKQI